MRLDLGKKYCGRQISGGFQFYRSGLLFDEVPGRPLSAREGAAFVAIKTLKLCDERGDPLLRPQRLAGVIEARKTARVLSPAQKSPEPLGGFAPPRASANARDARATDRAEALSYPVTVAVDLPPHHVAAAFRLHDHSLDALDGEL
jgi:hypothetical protein